MTMKEFLEQTCWTAFARNVMTTLIRVVMAAETYELSVLSFAWYIAAAQVIFPNTRTRMVSLSLSLSLSLARSLARSFALAVARSLSLTRCLCLKLMPTWATETSDFLPGICLLLIRWLQLRFDFDSTAVRLLIKGH